MSLLATSGFRGYAIARQPIGRDCLALDGLPAGTGVIGHIHQHSMPGSSAVMLSDPAISACLVERPKNGPYAAVPRGE